MDDQRARVFKELIDPAKLPETMRRFSDIVKASFVDDRTRIIINPYAIKNDPTQAEIRRRANIVYDWFTRLRGDMHYSMPKTMDLLPTALRETLDGNSWDPPPASRAWAGDQIAGQN